MFRRIQVEIITIGDEILIGQIVDTNSAWMAVELNKSGFEVLQITTVHDAEEQILDAIDQALGRADAVLLTGGIGPTKDDITKDCLCKYFATRLVFHEESLRNIEELFASRGIPLNDLTRAQAMLPESAIVIRNRCGTAPITCFEKEGKVLMSMPGVPYEMKDAMLSEVIPRLQRYFQTPHVIHKTLLVQGYPESALALKIADWERALPASIRLAYLPNYSIVRLRLSVVSDGDPLSLEFMLNQQLSSLKEILGNAIVAAEDITVERLIADRMCKAGKTLSTAESCTGGNIAHQLTLLPGASQYFKASVVAYDNSVKASLLQVDAAVLEEKGAVSREVVEQMAEGVRCLLKTDFALAVSGIAGPSGGSDAKPVGSTWIAVCSKDSMLSREFRFGTFREQNIRRATQSALLLLNSLLDADEDS